MAHCSLRLWNSPRSLCKFDKHSFVAFLSAYLTLVSLGMNQGWQALRGVLRSYRILGDDHWQATGNLYVRDDGYHLLCYDMSSALNRLSHITSSAALFYYWLTVIRSEEVIMPHDEFQMSLE